MHIKVGFLKVCETLTRFKELLLLNPSQTVQRYSIAGPDPQKEIKKIKEINNLFYIYLRSSSLM